MQASVEDGQVFTVTLTVTNTGQGVLDNVNASLLPVVTIPSGSFLPPAQPAPLATLASGASVTFTWAVSAVGTNPSKLTASLSATDQNSGQPVTSATFVTNPVTPVSPATIADALYLYSGAGSSTGCEFTPINVVLAVSNTAGAQGAAAIVTVPNPPTAFGAPTLYAGISLLSSSAASGTTVTVAGGGVTSFTWTYTATVAAGGSVFNFSDVATAVDADTSLAIAEPATATAATAYTLVGSVQMASALAVLPAKTFTTGQAGTVILTVTNTGSATAVSITPGALGTAITGGAYLSAPVSGPVPATVATWRQAPPWPLPGPSRPTAAPAAAT
jgi:hypothetical protein